MPGRMTYPGRRATFREGVELYHRLNLGNAGAITTQSKLSGVTATRQGVGLYEFTFQQPWAELQGVVCTVIGANSSYAQASGLTPFVTVDNISTTKKIRVQFRRTDTGANAEVENTAKLLWEFNVSDVALKVG